MPSVFIKSLLGIAVVLTPCLLQVPIANGGNSVVVDRPNFEAIFNGKFRQVIDRFGTVCRIAYDTSGRVIGVEVGRYDPNLPNHMSVETIYLEPDATHPQGQAFDGAGHPA